MSNTHDAPMLGHCYDAATRAYVLPVRLFPEPDGSCNLPENTVTVAPADTPGSYQALRLNESLTAWELVPDYRNVMLWQKASAMPVPNRVALGDVPDDDVTVLAPLPVDAGTPARNRWSKDLQGWELVPDYSQRPLWEKATAQSTAPLAAGEALPDALTTLPPPRNDAGPWRFDDASETWVKVETEPTEPQNPGNEPQS